MRYVLSFLNTGNILKHTLVHIIMKTNVIMVITTIVIVIQSYLIGYSICESKYKRYYDATETLLDSIDENDMLDVVMEGDEYQDYLKAKEEL